MLKLNNAILICYAFVITIAESKIFKDADIISETQVFPITEKARIDSISFEYFSTNKNDEIEIRLIKDKNFFRRKIDPIVIFEKKIYSSVEGINKETIKLIDYDIDLEREELFFEFSSKQGSRLITDVLERDYLCDSVIIDRVQYYETVYQKVIGRSEYRVQLYSSNMEDRKGISKKEIGGIDSTIAVNEQSNIAIVDINEDEYVDIVINNKLYINNMGNTFKEELEIFDDDAGYIYVLDLNYDGILEFIKLKTGEIEFISINMNFEISHKESISMESLSIEDVKTTAIIDYDTDGRLDFVIEKPDRVLILLNQYPGFELIEMKKDINTNVCVSPAGNRIYLHQQNSIYKDEASIIPNEYGFYLDDNTRVFFDNKTDDLPDKIQLSHLNTELGVLERRILKPKHYYLLPSGAAGSNYFVITSSCPCEPNYIF